MEEQARCWRRSSGAQEPGRGPSSCVQTQGAGLGAHACELSSLGRPYLARPFSPRQGQLQQGEHRTPDKTALPPDRVQGACSRSPRVRAGRTGEVRGWDGEAETGWPCRQVWPGAALRQP